MRRLSSAILAAALIGSLARTAAADQNENALLVSAGANLGLSMHDVASSGFVLGGEASLVLLHLENDESEHGGDAPGVPMIGTPSWLGLYGDVVRDTGSDTTRFSIGPEIGHGILGIDGGLLAQVGDESRWGVTVRPVLTIGVVALYGRWGHFYDDLPETDFVEAGLLLKWAFPLWEAKR